MTDKIQIPVQANVDTSQVEQRLNALGQKIAQANRMQFTPVSAKSVEDVNRVVTKFEQLLKINTELRKRMKDTGQEGAGFLNVDYGKIYSDANVRARQMRQHFEYVVGQHFVPMPQPPGGGGPGGPGGGAGLGPGLGGGGRGPGGGGNAPWVGWTQTALGGAGPVGGIAGRALGAGVSQGIGAGLMGLLGGLGALGVSRALSATMERVGVAEDNAVALDRLKRVVGDVGVSFEALKSVVSAGADNLKITYSEAGQLATQFSKLGNVSADKANTLADEMQTGVGLARAFGLDPSQGVGALGMLRGSRQTSDAQESKRAALLIGETIARSGAFGKADEVMDAIAGYVTNQNRANLGRSNVGGFAGAYSALIGSGIPGLDPAGAGALLSRVNASLTAGGAKGEASQFFSSMLANRLGLDPLQMQVFREGGAFETKAGAFGKGSIYASYMGKTGPDSGGGTYLAERLKLLREKYGGDKLLLAQATANDLGISMRQAMAMHMISPNEMGAMAKYAGDISSLNAGGIAALGKAVTGSAADRQAVADSLLRRKDVSADEKSRIQAAMSGGDAETQKQVLAEIIAQHDQEETQGKDIRDSKNALDNIKTAMADKLVPLAMEMRHGIMAIALATGQGKYKTSEDIMKAATLADSDARIATINGKADSEAQELMKRRAKIKTDISNLWKTDAKKAVEANDKAYAANGELAQIEKRLAEIQKERAVLLEKENVRRTEELSEIDKAADARREIEEATRTGANPHAGNRSGGRIRAWAGTGDMAKSAELREAVAAAEKEIGAPRGLLLAQMEQESGFSHDARSSAGAMGLAQVMPSTLASLEKRMGRKLDPYNWKDAVLIQKEIMRENYSQFGNWDDSLRAYNGGWDKSRWDNSETAGYVPSIHARMPRLNSTPMPYDAGAGRGSPEYYGLKVDPIVVRHEGPNGQQVRPDQTLNTRVSLPRAFGH